MLVTYMGTIHVVLSCDHYFALKMLSYLLFFKFQCWLSNLERALTACVRVCVCAHAHEDES